MVRPRKTLLGAVSLVAIYLLAGCREKPGEAITGPIATELRAASSQAATTSTTNEKISPFGFDIDGCVETVRFSGTLHAVAHTTVTSTGNVHAFFQFNPVGGVSAVGLTTGTRYVVPGMRHESFNSSSSGFPLTDTFVNNFQIIGQGSMPNMNFQERAQITIYANGDMAVVFDNVRVECH